MYCLEVIVAMNKPKKRFICEECKNSYDDISDKTGRCICYECLDDIARTKNEDKLDDEKWLQKHNIWKG